MSTLNKGVFKIKKVVSLIPCYNEEQGIGIVIDSIPRLALDALGYGIEVLVIDNNCTDRTSEIAKSKGARVIKEHKQGKGHALMRGFRELPSDAGIVVVIDGDGSYDMKELIRILEPLENDFGDVIFGSRLHGRLTQKAMTGLNRFGNWLLTFLVRVGYKTNVTDVCSGFFAFKKHVINDLILHLKSNSFSIEMEIIAKLARMNYSCYSVPISYYPRNGKSSLKPIKDGVIIFYSWLKYLNWSPKVEALTSGSLFHETDKAKE